MPRRIKKFASYDLLSDMEINSLTLDQKEYDKKDNLYAWFKFETDISTEGEALDYAGATRNLVSGGPSRPTFLNNAPLSVPTVNGFAERSYGFVSGSGTILKAAANNTFNFTKTTGADPANAFTISSWVKFDSFLIAGTDDQFIISKYNPGSQAQQEYYLALDGTGKHIKFAIFGGGGKQLLLEASDLSLLSGHWYHIVAVFTGIVAAGAGINSGIMIYVDGIATSRSSGITGGAFTYIPDSTAFFSAGNHFNNAADTDLLGSIAEVAVWEQALTSDNIQVLYSFRDTIEYRFSSGFVNLPPRVLLRQLDNATGSYPTVLRMGDKDRKGNYKRSFDDNYTINFGKKIKDAFELVNKEGSGTLGFSKEIRSDRWTHSVGMEIRQEILSTTSIEEKGNGALVFSSGETSAASGRWIQTKDKIKNPRVKLRLIIGPYNQDRTVLGYGLGLASGAATDVLKIQIDDNISFTSPTDIKTIQNNITSILAQPSTRTTSRTASDAARKIVKIDLYPADFPGDVGSFYLRVIQDSVSDKDDVIWALSEIEIDYHDEENISYPLMINTDTIVGQKIVSASVTAPHIAPTLKGPGRSVSGISDIHLSFTPGEDISAFNDNSHFFDDTSIFFSQGTDPNILPGFSSPVSNKTIIEVDLNANTQTTFGLDSRTAVESTGDGGVLRGPRRETDDTVKQQLMVYWNKDLKRWEKIAQGVSGNAAAKNGEGHLPLVNMITSGALGFSGIGMCSTGSDATLANQTPVNQDALLSYARPTSTFGFPFEGKYEATASQFIKARDIGITKPFLLEKCSIAFEAKFEFASNQFDSGSRAYSLDAATGSGTNPSARTLSDNQKVYIPTFFMLRQSKDILNTAVSFDTEFAGFSTGSNRSILIPDPAVHLSTATGLESIVSVDKSRELITYGQMTMFVSGVANTAGSGDGRGETSTQVDIDTIIQTGLGRDTNINILSMNGQTNFNIATSGQLSPITGNFNINFPCRLSPKIENTCQTILILSKSGGTAPTDNTVGALLLGNTLGGRGAGDLASSARALANGYAATKKGIPYLHFAQDSAQLPISLVPPNAETIDLVSPYIIMPDDELVFGWQYPMTTRIVDAAPGKSDAFLNTMSLFGNSKLKLIGSIVKDTKEYHEGLNQNLSSNAVHEIIGAEPPIDQFQVSKQGENLGNFYDTAVDSKSSVPATRVGSSTESRITTTFSPIGAASGKIIISSLTLTPTLGISSGSIFGLTGSDGTKYQAGASGATSTSLNTFQLYGTAATYSDAYYTLLELQSLLLTDSPSNTLFDVAFSAYLALHPPSWSVALTITQKIGGSAGNKDIAYNPTGTARVSVSNFTAGTDSIPLKENSFARNVLLRDAARIYADSTGSTGAFTQGSSFGLMQSVGGIAPKYYFDSKKYGQFFDFIDQGKDSKFAQSQNLNIIDFKGAALQSPVEIIFVSGTNESTIGVKKFGRKSPTLSVNKTVTSALTSSFVLP